jgi:hypothetical protein
MNRRAMVRGMFGAVFGGRKVVGDVAQGIAAQSGLGSLGASFQAPTGQMDVGYGPPMASARRPLWVKALESAMRKRESDVYERASAFQDALANRVPPDIAALQSTAAHWRGHVHLRRHRREIKGPLEEMRKRIDDWYTREREDN